MNVQANKDLQPIGHLLQVTGHTMRSVERAAASLGLEPAMRIAGVDYFDADQCEQIASHFREADAK